MRAHASFFSGAFWLVPVLLVGCSGKGSSATANSGGSTGTTGATASGPTTTAGPGATTGTATGGGIPAAGPGNGVDNNFGSVEPDNTPQQATPLGTSALNGINVWVNNNAIGMGTDTSDYFVFNSSPMGGPFTFDICFTAPITGMTATLWKVVGGAAQMPPIATWAPTATCVTNMGGTAVALAPSTEYLFGLTSTGGAGTYSA